MLFLDHPIIHTLHMYRNNYGMMDSYEVNDYFFDAEGQHLRCLGKKFVYKTEDITYLYNHVGGLWPGKCRNGKKNNVESNFT